MLVGEDKQVALSDNELMVRWSSSLSENAVIVYGSKEQLAEVRRRCARDGMSSRGRRAPSWASEISAEEWLANI